METTLNHDELLATSSGVALDVFLKAFAAFAARAGASEALPPLQLQVPPSVRIPDAVTATLYATAMRFATGRAAKPGAPDPGTADTTARQRSLFEQIRLSEPLRTEPASSARYALRPLSPDALFPVPVGDAAIPGDAVSAGKDYRALWDAFVTAIDDIPASHRARLDLWLDHVDTLWMTFGHVVPAVGAEIPDAAVSLYDESKIIAALAVALWRYHHARGDDLTAMGSAQVGDSDAADRPLLLIQGDLFGIQDFIFASGGATQRRAAKLLRGRSFYVGLLTECAAMRVLDALALPPTSQIINAAGKFLIVAPNTEATLAGLETVRAALDAWFIEHSYAQAGIGLAWLAAGADELSVVSAHGDDGFRGITGRLFAELEQAKAQRFGLCTIAAPSPLFEGFLDRFDNTRGVCSIDGRSPAVTEISEAGHCIQIGRLAKDQVDLGNWLTQHKRVLVSRRRIVNETLAIDLFGYCVGFTGSAAESGPFGPEVATDNLLRAWDFSLPEADGARTLWNGCARRAINAYIPRFVGDETANAWFGEKYRDAELEEGFSPGPWEPKTFNHLACEDQTLDADRRWVGIRALATLKGDVDNLGRIFQHGLEVATLPRMAALSRQMNAFFAVYLPWLCQGRYPNAYTVFAGGDDFFLIGPWHAQIRLAADLRTAFKQYVAGNPDIHFSAGLSLTKPGLPVRYLAALGERALEAAKHNRPEKDSVTCFDQSVAWETYDALVDAGAELSRLADEFSLSTAYLYGLLDLVEKAEQVDERPENAMWHSQFAYRTFRMLERAPGLTGRDKDPERRRLMQQLAVVIAQNGIERYGGAYRIPLFTHLYRTRD
ncbi:MAG: type III-A CRISPR-associated protein Cas10/Csm1 [Thiohalocapsa sp.]|nr:type III-A CRISPR-associated protein Cas10/Csm1 [Thiohalocapsa sp.]